MGSAILLMTQRLCSMLHNMCMQLMAASIMALIVAPSLLSHSWVVKLDAI